ncbi:MAG: outer membrane porin, OprD family [Sulfurovum sp.]|nr:OprD family porin [Sulfurovum sp.]NNJ45974.1 outer membrane porin, OprD family [Sulfurovum sp.]
MSTDIYAETLNALLENITTEFEISTTQEDIKQPVSVQSVRSILSGYDPLEHTRGQVRAGYINFTEDGSPQTRAYALAGHVHFNTQMWNGLMLGAEAYTVLNLGNNQKYFNLNNDFFDVDGESFILLSQAYLDGKWGNTEIKLGRQSLDTPHSDSDDIRMIPNYFEVYNITNTDVEDVTLSAGFINRMAGWENGVDSSEFVNISETLGVNQKMDGIYYASASYEGSKDLSLSLWYYNYHDIANVLYAEAGYSHELSKNISLILGLQYDGSKETGAALLGKQDAQTYGISLETNFTDIGVTVLAAYNQDNGDTGAMGLSLGGGPFFTSMEDQTLDVMETAGSAWIIGAGYDLGKMGLGNFIIGVAYGSFKADDSSLYESREIDAVLEYNFNDKITASAAYASVDFKVNGMENYNQFRVIANYNF